ncbi:hypothetical protein QAD02_006611 [Eretmocerus hayati]|uniref:Uncharacterized protein n=1 Tax=Eretmocerus hayati TaxID=131215 RepID=A0ACC2N1N0_9HYME|nr:hypothetical protein QAD02_006611 [Eretmocerus hayati]
MRRLKWIVVNILFLKVFAAFDQDFVCDYFAHKNVSRLTVFTCNNIQENIIFTRKFHGQSVIIELRELSEGFKLNRIITSEHQKMGILLDLRCYRNTSSSPILSQITSREFYRQLHYWLVTSNDLESVLDMVDDNRFSMTTDFVIAIPIKFYIGFDLYDIYNPSKERGGKLNVTFFGSWDPKHGLNLELSEDKYSQRSNLHGMMWKVSFFGVRITLQFL